MTVGDFFAFTLYLGHAGRPGDADRQHRQPAHRGVRRPGAHPRDPQRGHGGRRRGRARSRSREVDGRIEFRDVRFEYQAGHAGAARGISFTAEPGTSTALVGPSGSGKSTLIGLVAAFHRPTAGQILVDGQDLADLRLARLPLAARRGLPGQLPVRRHGAARTSPTRGPTPPTRRSCARPRIARCDDFVRRFADGYDTIVGERGVKLSGGERQRVAIARAILADPRILILDEATSSLDSESEALIQEGLAELMKGRTTFVIAHRLSTIRRADTILVLEDGADRRARPARGAARPRRPLPRPLHPAVRPRVQPLPQPRRGGRGRGKKAAPAKAADANIGRLPLIPA